MNFGSGYRVSRSRGGFRPNFVLDAPFRYVPKMLTFDSSIFRNNV
jgi:hypothetical protein